MAGFRCQGNGDDQESEVRSQKPEERHNRWTLFSCLSTSDFCLLTPDFFTEDDTKMLFFSLRLTPAVPPAATAPTVGRGGFAMATAARRSGIATATTGRSGIPAATAASIGARGRGPFNYNRLTDVQ